MNYLNVCNIYIYIVKMNDIIDDMYLKYIECLETKDKDLCNFFYLNRPTPITIKTSTEEKGYKETWRFVNRGNFVKK